MRKGNVELKRKEKRKVEKKRGKGMKVGQNNGPV